jgi:hypothetical protein
MATVSELIIKRQKDVSRGWQSFLQQQPLHRSIAVVVEREKTNLPAKFVPWAPGIVIASDDLLKVARHTPRLQHNWHRHRRYGYYERAKLIVRERSGFWFMECEHHVLVFRYGSMPICTRTHQAAIDLFEYILPQSQNVFERPLGPQGHGATLGRIKARWNFRLLNRALHLAVSQRDRNCRPTTSSKLQR